MCREKYVGGPTNSVTRKELGALFDVTGTPSWRDVEGVQSATWRNYLQRLPGRAPTLFRRLGYAGEPHLDPGRCGCPAVVTHIDAVACSLRECSPPWTSSMLLGCAQAPLAVVSSSCSKHAASGWRIMSTGLSAIVECSQASSARLFHLTDVTQHHAQTIAVLLP